tara:strand:+ start:5532 stop:6149 length:618 start_codon:yes stop_codon:yes gene_type:complete
MKIKSLLFLMFWSIFSVNGKQTVQLNQISCSVKWWAVFHPFVALKSMKISSKSRLLANSDSIKTIFGNDGNGGGLDAFRHTYWMASLSQEIGNKKALKLGIAHEKGNRKDFEKKRLEEGQLPDRISVDMDLHNNAVGVLLTQKNGVMTQEELIKRIYSLYSSGKLVVVKKDSSLNSLTIDGKIIPDGDWQGKWENDRVLIPSNCD